MKKTGLPGRILKFRRFVQDVSPHFLARGNTLDFRALFSLVMHLLDYQVDRFQLVGCKFDEKLCILQEQTYLIMDLHTIRWVCWAFTLIAIHVQLRPHTFSGSIIPEDIYDMGMSLSVTNKPKVSVIDLTSS